MAVIGRAHGVRGEVRVKSYAENPKDFAAYGPLTDAAGARTFTIVEARPQKTVFVTRFKEVTGRTDAEALNGTELFVPRERLNEDDDPDAFFHADLIGLKAGLADGGPFGTVIAVHDFGAGDLLDIRLADTGKSVLVPFTQECVPSVDIAAGRLVVMPPPGLLDDDEDGDIEDSNT